MAGMDGWPGSAAALPALCEAVRAAFAAHSCVIAQRGRVLGAAVAPAPVSGAARADRPARAAGERQACVVGDSHAGLEITLVAGEPVAPGQAELLELVATIAAKLAGE
jgi:hypothetical protein